MRSIDRLFEHSSRTLARHTSRRSLLAMLGKLLTGAALIPLLPVDPCFSVYATGRRLESRSATEYVLTVI